MKPQLSRIKYTAFLLIVSVTCAVPSVHAASSSDVWSQIMEGVHMNEGIEKSFGSVAGGRFKANTYLDLEALPPYGKAGVFAEGSVFIKDVHTWSILKTEGFVEGGLNVVTSYDDQTDDLVLTFSAGADAVVDIDFLSKQIYYFSAAETLAGNGNEPIKKTWESRFDISEITPMLENAGEVLGIGKEGAFQLLADAVQESVKALIKSNIQQGGRELTIDEKLKNTGKLVAKQLYKIALMRLSKSTGEQLDMLISDGYTFDQILDAMKTGVGNSEMETVASTQKQISAIRSIYKAVVTLLSFSYDDSANGLKIGLSKDYKWEKQLPGYSQTHMVGGIVPVRVDFGGSAAIGARWEVGLELAGVENSNSNFYMQVGPYVSAGAYASAALDAFIAQAGVSGSIDLIEDELMITMRAPFPKVWTNLQGSIDNVLSTANGKLDVFVSWTEPQLGWVDVYKKVLLWKPWTFYWEYRWVSELRLTTVTKKVSKTLLEVNGPSWTMSFPLFSFENPQTPVIKASNGEFSLKLL